MKDTFKLSVFLFRVEWRQFFFFWKIEQVPVLGQTVLGTLYVMSFKPYDNSVSQVWLTCEYEIHNIRFILLPPLKGNIKDELPSCWIE